MKSIASFALAAAVCAFAAPASAQFAKPEDAVKYRQSALFVMAQHFGRIGAMANGRVPYDAKAAVDNAEVVADMAKLPWAGFGAGTDKISKAAKPEIWTDADKFRTAITRMQDEMVKLNAAAKGGNIDAIKAASGEVGKACKGCHDDFRRE